ncbi:MAG: hypothetical protein ACR2OE_06905 [Thermomicrobiales bacterium]
MIERSLAAIMQPAMQPLPFSSFTVNGESIFISGHIVPDDHARRVHWLYEFSRWGEFRRRVDLSLIDFRRDGQSWIEARVAGELIIQDDYFYLHEDVRIRSSESIARIDYLFSRDGRRLSVWSNRVEPNNCRLPSELVIAYAPEVRVDWFAHHRIYAITPRITSPSAQFTSHTVHALETALLVPHKEPLQNTALDTVPLALATAVPHSGQVVFSIASEVDPDRAPYAGNYGFSPGWWGTCTNGDDVWFISCSENTLWCLAMENEGFSVTTYTLPAPRDLAIQNWIYLWDETRNRVEPDDDYDPYDGLSYDSRFFVSGDLVAATIWQEVVDGPADVYVVQSNIVVFRIDRGHLQPVHSFDPAYFTWGLLPPGVSPPISEADPIPRSEYVHALRERDVELMGLCDQRLFVKSYLDEVYVIDLRDATMHCFEPEVPADAYV